MKATEAIDRLNPDQWASTPIHERLHLLEEVRENMKRHAGELGASDTKMKNGQMGEALFTDPMSVMATVVPMANTIGGCIHLYESLIHGQMLEPIEITEVQEGLYDVHVFPQEAKDKLMNATRRDVVRVKGEPKQISPMDKPAGIIAVLGAGNYSSSLEMIKAIFLENCAVVHKPHHLNAETDAIWETIMQPLIDVGALSFCDADQGRVLTQDGRLSKIYFTGGTGTAKAIMGATETPLVAECGGNNPCIIVPGDRPWTDKEITHQALQIATMAKLNGGAVCGRPQTIVTSKNWEQRHAFMQALRQALEHDTPAAGTYYPGSDKVIEGFKEAHPEGVVLQPENGQYENADFYLITGVPEDGYAVTHEAFCQILDEVPLDTADDAEAFLPAAVEFCNGKLLGTLGCCILCDDDTLEAHRATLEQAVTGLRYGGIAVNTMPPFIFLSPYLTWGGNEEGREFVSGHSNFGNLLCFENIEKSIIYDKFVSPGHMLNTNKHTMDALLESMAAFSLAPTWMNLTKLMAGAVVGNFRGKDFEG